MKSMIDRIFATVLVLFICYLGPIAQVSAHPLAPTLLQLDVAESGLVAVTWKTSRMVPNGSKVKPHLPDHCKPFLAPDVKEDPTSVVLRWQVDCGDRGLMGATIRVSGLADSGLNTLVRLLGYGQETRTWLLTGKNNTLLVAAPPTKLEVALDYGQLGIHHLLFGPDHVLLVLALMMIIASTRMLLITITAFTLGHSITLSLATLGLVNVPAAPVEVAIAASIMLVAANIPRDAKAPTTALGRAPWIVALAFGLLHGFGFAGALAEIGLPASEIPLALLCFNIGIEIGQIAIVLVAWGLLCWWSSSTNRGRLAVTYAIGGLAGFWTLERLAMLTFVP